MYMNGNALDFCVLGVGFHLRSNLRALNVNTHISWSPLRPPLQTSPICVSTLFITATESPNIQTRRQRFDLHPMSIPVIDKAFLPEYQKQLLIPVIAVMGIPLIVQVYIGVSVYWKLHDTESNIRPELIYLFLLCVVFAVLSTSSAVIYNVFILMSYTSHPAYFVFLFIEGFFYGLFFLMLLLTFITRLYLTFNETALKMTKVTVYVFAIIFVLVFISIILTNISLVSFTTSSFNWTFFLCSWLPGFLMCIVGCALAVRLFAVNLSTVAKMQMGPQRDVSPRAKDISLNDKQQKLLHLSAKYVLLFFTAVFSSAFNCFLALIVSYELRGLFASIDLCVNLVCMYLQFAFAAEQYQKCCGYLDSRCRELEMKRMKRTIHKDLMSMPGQLATMMK